jgi:hypothetical protein
VKREDIFLTSKVVWKLINMISWSDIYVIKSVITSELCLMLHLLFTHTLHSVCNTEKNHGFLIIAVFKFINLMWSLIAFLSLRSRAVWFGMDYRRLWLSTSPVCLSKTSSFLNIISKGEYFKSTLC